MLTEDEAHALTQLSARITALELIMAWLLRDFLRRNTDVSPADLLAYATTIDSSGIDQTLVTAYQRRVEMLIQQAEQLLHARNS